MVAYFRRHLQQARNTKLERRQAAVSLEQERLAALHDQHIQQLELELAARRDAESRKAQARQRREAAIKQHFDEYHRWLDESVQTEDEPYIQILAVITGDPGERLVDAEAQARREHDA